MSVCVFLTLSLCMLYILQIIPLVFEFRLNSTYLFQGIDGYRYMLKKENRDRLEELYQHERVK